MHWYPPHHHALEGTVGMAGMPESARRFTEALNEYIHHAGVLLVVGFREVARLQRRFDRAVALAVHDAVTGDAIDARVEELSPLRENVKAAYAAAVAAAIEPPHPIDGIEPRDWVSQVLSDLQESKHIVCGRLQGAEPISLNEKEEGLLLATLRRLDAAKDRIATFRYPSPVPPVLGAPAADAGQEEVSSSQTTGNLDDKGMFTAGDLAKHFDLPFDLLRKRLERWRKEHAASDGWLENEEAMSRTPRFSYQLGKIRHIIDQILSDKASNERPTKEKKTAKQRGN